MKLLFDLWLSVAMLEILPCLEMVFGFGRESEMSTTNSADWLRSDVVGLAQVKPFLGTVRSFLNVRNEVQVVNYHDDCFTWPKERKL